MGSAAPRTGPWTRRAAVAATLLGLGFAAVPGIAASQRAATVLIVSRKRLLNETDHARALLKAELELTAELQRRVDAIKAELSAEEQELVGLRQTLDRESFEARVAAFDQRVRRERRETQHHVSNLKNVFRAERLKLVEAMQPLLEQARAERGASVILNSDQALVSDPALDITSEVIASFNASVPPPQIPDLETIIRSQVPEVPDDREKVQ